MDALANGVAYLNELSVLGIPFWALVGFCLAAYAIVANDVIQTLGTFLSSNGRRSWVILWLYGRAINNGVMAYGWYFYDGDIAFDKLNEIPYPEGGVQWWHAVPPLFLLVLTRFGIPVSTTFLVLSIFTLTGGAATAGVLGDMLFKSLSGYVVAFAAGAVVYLIISRLFERWIANTELGDVKPYLVRFVITGALATAVAYLLLAGPVVPDPQAYRDQLIAGATGFEMNLALGATIAVALIAAFAARFNIWFAVQWISTAFLWAQWLMQDLANIFVFLPRETVVEGDVISVTFALGLLVFATGLMVLLHAIIFATRGGEIQKIVLTKTNTTDPRAATFVDLIFGLVLLYFKELNDVPMSTTWVFLGLLAGRELAISLVARLRTTREAAFDVVTDVVRAGIGLVVSVALALAVPYAATGEFPDVIEQIFGAAEG